MAATAVWALWTTAEHVGSMARPTTDDNITVYDDNVFCDSERHERSLCSIILSDPKTAGGKSLPSQGAQPSLQQI